MFRLAKKKKRLLMMCRSLFIHVTLLNLPTNLT